MPAINASIAVGLPLSALLRAHAAISRTPEFESRRSAVDSASVATEVAEQSRRGSVSLHQAFGMGAGWPELCLRPGTQDVVEQGLAQGEFSRIVQKVEAEAVHCIGESRAGFRIGKRE